MSNQVVFENGRYNGRTLKDWLPQIRDRIVTSFSPEQIVLFGSLAEGKPNADSDVDLLVVLDTVDEPHRLMRELRTLLADIPVPIDVVPISAEDYGLDADIPGTLPREAERSGVTLYDRR
jgi:predicted nucleotidyltransferase